MPSNALARADARWWGSSAAGGRTDHENSRCRSGLPTRPGACGPPAGLPATRARSAPGPRRTAPDRAGPRLPRPARPASHPPRRPAWHSRASAGNPGRQYGGTRIIASAEDSGGHRNGPQFAATTALRSASRNARLNINPRPPPGSPAAELPSRRPVVPGAKARPAWAGTRRPAGEGRRRGREPFSPRPGLCLPPHRLVTCPGRLPAHRRRNSTEISAVH